VVLAHSYLWDAAMWRPQIAALSRHYRVIVPNLWGHGDAGPLPSQVTDLGEIARRHLALLDRLEVGRFALVGHSTGAMWGAELACLAPGRVAAFALLNSFVAPEPDDGRARYFAMLDEIAAAGTIPERVLAAVVPYFFSPAFSATMPEAPAALRTRLAGWDRARLLDTIVPLGRMIFGRRDALTELVSKNIPAQVITGADDYPRPVHEGRRMAHALGCGFVELPAVGHMSTIEAPALVNAHLLAFLDDAVRNPSGSAIALVSIGPVQKRVGAALLHPSHDRDDGKYFGNSRFLSYEDRSQDRRTIRGDVK
jgi:pimeloyl-ACP methyl ester carboxylesterase